MSCVRSQFGSRLVSILELLRVFADKYVQTTVRLDIAIFSLERRDIWQDKKLQELLLVELDQLGTVCLDCDLPVTEKIVRKTAAALLVTPPPVASPVFAQYLHQIRETFIAELGTKLFFQIPSSRAIYFDTPWLNWEDIRDRWEPAATNIEEMNKCFALSRYAASVIHSLIVVEHGLIDLGQAIGVTDPKPGWDATCKKMQAILNAGHPAYSLTSITFANLEQINGCAQSMKSAWRNKVNHAAGQLAVMTADFAPDVAEEIIIATRSFMRRLASALPQSKP